MLSAGIGEFGKENDFLFTSGARAYFGMVGASYGIFKGFRYTLIHDARELHQVLRIQMPYAASENADSAAEELRAAAQAECKYIRASYIEEHCICFDLWRRIGAVKRKDIESLLTFLSKTGHKLRLRPGCCRCGAPAGRFVGEDDVPYFCCPEHETVLKPFHAVTTERRSREPVRAVRGLVGGMLFSLIGVLFWCIMVAFLHKIAAVAGYVIIYGAIKGYQLFRGRLTKGSVIALLILSLCMMVGAEYMALVLLEAQAALQAGVSVQSAVFFARAGELIRTGSSLGDLIWGFAFVFAGWCVHLLGIFRKPKNSIGYSEVE